jgi:hypothetical protein
LEKANDAAPLVFGIYPGGDNGGDTGMIRGRPADPARIQDALARLQGRAASFVVRVYERFDDSGTAPHTRPTPAEYEPYARDGRHLDLVLMFQSWSGDVPGFLEFVRGMVRQQAPRLFSVQVTEEANFTTGPDVIDGPYPRVREALVKGVQAARDELNRMGYGKSVAVGFSATPTFGPSAEFWGSIGALGGGAFVEALDYVALDFFPDVFRPVAPDGLQGDLADSVLMVLKTLRNEWLPAAGLGTGIPIHVGENGWPTCSDRTYERQALVIKTVVRTVHQHRAALNVARYTLFSLRDAVSDRDDFWYQFGILRDDYSPKPAFEVYRSLVEELGAAHPQHAPAYGRRQN